MHSKMNLLTYAYGQKFLPLYPRNVPNHASLYANISCIINEYIIKCEIIYRMNFLTLKKYT